MGLGIDEISIGHSRTVDLRHGTPDGKREEILRYFHETSALYESLFECLAGDDAYLARPNPLRHPLIFYYGHTAVFFINKLRAAGIVDAPIDPRLESLLAVGVDEMSWDDLREGRDDWPAPADVRAYRAEVCEVVDAVMKACAVTIPIEWNDPLWIVMMGIEHERIHLETSSVLIRELPLEHVRPHPLWGRICRTRGAAPENTLLPVAGGRITLGKSRNNPYYGWDNEYGVQVEEIASFKASQYLVSNTEYLAFVEDGGYSQRRYWTEEGWNWAVYRHAEHPVYWVRDDGRYRLRTMLEIIEMPWNWPVEVNYLEAKAFCTWKSEQTGASIRLPTEAEWYRLRELVDTDQPEWERAPGNVNLEHYMSACPVDEFAFDGGFYDIIGNVWQWTETPIDAFEGFAVHPVYDDFSTPTFDGKHNLFKGGCWISTGNYALRDSRYAFRRHFHQHAGFRYVEAGAYRIHEPNPYETDRMVSLYVEFHYGDTYFEVPNYPKACADICLEHMRGRRRERALDIGCAVGRFSFEIAGAFDRVDAVDFSARFIQVPSNLQRTGRQQYAIQDEGELVRHREVRLDDFAFRDAAHKVVFAQGDACNLADKYGGYDLVFAGNLVDRLYDPARFLEIIPERIRPGGLLVISSPHTWLEEFTARAKWLGGFKTPRGAPYTTFDALRDRLSPSFALVDRRDVPFVIRETTRKFQHSIADMTIWERSM
ncbi:MAG: 5-histidylcysteine sulfoxide synthase [Bauldia sp.]|nr:5-histidylcysteine sulfoxide synthase [Bauldia sp.]